MKLNRDMIFAAGTVVAIVIAVVAAVLLFGGISKFSAAEKKLQTSIKRLRMFYSEDPFPSKENIEREKQNAGRLRDWYGKLMKSLREGEIAPNPADASPSRWTAMYGAKRSELRKKAADGGVELPPGFAFGFDEYALGSLPPPSDVPLLTQHLKIVDSLCSLVIGEGAESIRSVKRDAVGAAAAAGLRHPTATGTHGNGGSLVGRPTSRGAGARRPPSSARRRPASARKRPVSNVAAKPQGPLYAKQHFELEFRARERTVLAILNKLARSSAFTIVTSVEMVREGEDILKAEQTIRDVGEGSVALAEMTTDDYPSSIERMVCGVEMEQPMQVRIKLNVYNFVGE